MKRILILASALFASSTLLADSWFKLYVVGSLCPETTNSPQHLPMVSSEAQPNAPGKYELSVGDDGTNFTTVGYRDYDSNKYLFAYQTNLLEARTNTDVATDEFTNMWKVNPSNHWIDVSSVFPDICSLHTQEWTTATLYYDGAWNGTRHWEFVIPVTIQPGKAGSESFYYITNHNVQQVQADFAFGWDYDMLHPEFPPPWPHLTTTTNGELHWTINGLANMLYKVQYSTDLSVDRSTWTNWIEVGAPETGFGGGDLTGVYTNYPFAFFTGYGTPRDHP